MFVAVETLRRDVRCRACWFRICDFTFFDKTRYGFNRAVDVSLVCNADSNLAQTSFKAARLMGTDCSSLPHSVSPV